MSHPSHPSRLSRRTLVVGSAAVATLFSSRPVLAQRTAAMGEGSDWFTSVQTQHAMIAKSFDALLATKSGPPKASLLKAIAYQLTAHSTAEENVLYPLIAQNGMQADADKLYLDQAHAKILNAEIDMNALLNQSGDSWKDAARTLQQAVLKHAKEDEEGNYYPQLRQKLSPTQTSIVSSQFKVQFASVRPAAIV